MLVQPIQNAFNAGELSPLLDARSDVDKYKKGMRVCLNALPLVQGAWTRRGGTYYASPTKGYGVARLLSFEFSITQAYQIEIGALYFRFYMNHGPITLTPQNISGVTQGNPGVLTYTGTDPSNGDDVEITGVVGMTQLNGRRFNVQSVNTGAKTFQLYDPDGVTPIDTTAFTAYSSGGTIAKVYTVTHTYAAGDIASLKFTQSADTLYITHQNYPPAKLTRTAHTSWTLTPITFLDGPYLNTNISATTLTLSGTSGSVTVTASGSTFTTVTDIGRLIRFKDPAGNWTWLLITAVASATSATATISGPNASAGTATVNWRLGVWSITTGFPAAVCFNSDRLCFGGPTLYPQRVDMSNSGDYENFAPTNAAGAVGDANAIAISLNASDVNVIRWLQDNEKGLFVGTVRGEWILRASTTGNAITPSNITAQRSSNFGSANFQAIRAGKSTLYLQRAGRKLRELVYDYVTDGFNSQDMTVLAEHITLGGISQCVYQQETEAIIWSCRTDGTLIGFTFEESQQVLGWHRHVLGGVSDSLGMVQAKAESVSTNPDPNQVRDEVWVIANRYINGKTRRYVEYMKKCWEHGDVQSDAFHVDAGLSLVNTIAATLTPGTGANVVKTGAVIFTAGSAIFALTDVGRFIHYDWTDINGVLYRASAVITGYTDSTHVTATILSAWPNLTQIASAGWRMTVTSVSGLWHLEGQTVQIFADGATLPAQTVTLGTVPLTYAASKVTAGLGFNSDGQILRIDAGNPQGTAQGKIRRVHKVGFRFLDSLGLSVGRDFNNLVKKVFRQSSDPSGVAPPLFSGDKLYDWEGDYDTDGFICWRQDQPEPCTILGIFPELKVADG